MSLDEIRAALQAAGLAITSEQRLPYQTGTQLRLKNGAIVNCFDSGTFNVQGKNQPEVKAALGVEAPVAVSAAAPQAGAPNKVFVVYGHDESSRTQLGKV